MEMEDEHKPNLCEEHPPNEYISILAKSDTKSTEHDPWSKLAWTGWSCWDPYPWARWRGKHRWNLQNLLEEACLWGKPTVCFWFWSDFNDFDVFFSTWYVQLFSQSRKIEGGEFPLIWAIANSIRFFEFYSSDVLSYYFFVFWRGDLRFRVSKLVKVWSRVKLVWRPWQSQTPFSLFWLQQVHW